MTKMIHDSKKLHILLDSSFLYYTIKNKVIFNFFRSIFLKRLTNFLKKNIFYILQNV